MSNNSYNNLQLLMVYLGLQIFAAVLPFGPTRHTLNASYKTADKFSFQVTWKQKSLSFDYHVADGL
jgi:hypothetical protein